MEDMMDKKIEAALGQVFNAIIQTEILALFNSGNNFCDAVNLWAERNGEKVSNLPKKKSKFAMEIQDLDDEAIKELCRTQYQIFTNDAERCLIQFADERFIEYSMSSLTSAMSLYAISQLECITNGATWGFPIDFIEGNGGSVIGVKSKFRERILKFHWDFGKAYKKVIVKVPNPLGDGNFASIIWAAGLIHYSDKRLFEYPVTRDFPYSVYPNEPIPIEVFQKTYAPSIHIYRNKDITTDYDIWDPVTSQFQINPITNLAPNKHILCTYKFTTPPCSKVSIKIHLATFGVNFGMRLVLSGEQLLEYHFPSQNLTGNCPNLEVIKVGLANGGQIPSNVKYGILEHVFEFSKKSTSYVFVVTFNNDSYDKTDCLHWSDLGITLLE